MKIVLIYISFSLLIPLLTRITAEFSFQKRVFDDLLPTIMKATTIYMKLLLYCLGSLCLKTSIVVAIHKASYYDILKVPKTADEKEIKKAYRKLAVKHHPDKGGDEDKFVFEFV